MITVKLSPEQFDKLRAIVAREQETEMTIVRSRTSTETPERVREARTRAASAGVLLEALNRS